jgi:hypothetical protein
MIYQGQCHCGAIAFEVEAPADLEAEDCNCSICRMTGFQHLIVPESKFKLLSGDDKITTYQFNTGVAAHTFCKICGIKPFYTPRSNPDGIDINVRCLTTRPQSLKLMPFDGQNWELNAHALAHKSQES